jgi:hypothetical protein
MSRNLQNNDASDSGVRRGIECSVKESRLRHQPYTYFDSYQCRLRALAHSHSVDPVNLKALIEDAFGKCDSPPAEQESRQAMMKLAKLKIGPKDINWLFQYHIA